MSRLRPVDGRPCLFDRVVGTGGVGWGISFLLEENRALGREESRLAHLRDARDYCKLHIIAHYLAVLLGAPRAGITVHPVGRVGDDQPGRRLRDELRSAGACLEHLGVATGAQTLFSTCLQYPDGSGGNITSSNSASGLVDASDIDDAFASACLRVPGRTLALAVPEVPLAARLRLLELGRSTGAFTAASFTATEAAAFVAAGGPRLADLVAINAEEADGPGGRDDPPRRRPGRKTTIAEPVREGARWRESGTPARRQLRVRGLCRVGGGNGSVALGDRNHRRLDGGSGRRAVRRRAGGSRVRAALPSRRR